MKTKFSLPDEEIEKINQEAEEAGIPQAEYARTRLRAGRLVFKSSEFRPEQLQQLIEDESKSSEKADQKTITDDIERAVFKVLPDSSDDEGLTKEEIRELVFGTEKEQMEKINSALEGLHQEGKIGRAFGGGFVKNE